MNGRRAESEGHRATQTAHILEVEVNVSHATNTLRQAFWCCNCAWLFWAAELVLQAVFHRLCHICLSKLPV